jgi:hypothetical protein
MKAIGFLRIPEDREKKMTFIFFTIYLFYLEREGRQFVQKLSLKAKTLVEIRPDLKLTTSGQLIPSGSHLICKNGFRWGENWKNEESSRYNGSQVFTEKQSQKQGNKMLK